MIVSTQNNANIDGLITAIYCKSKRSFSYSKDAIKKQAFVFSPGYREFVLKVIKNSALKIINSYESYIVPTKSNEELVNTNYKRRKKNTIFVDIYDVDALPHELGHAVDFWFSNKQSLTKSVIIENNKTLYDIFTEEFLNKKEQLYEMVMNEYKQTINEHLGDNAYETIMDNIELYRKLKRYPLIKEYKEKRKQIQATLYNNGFVETYYQLIKSKCYAEINNKYSPILDALSSQYDFDGLNLDHHKKFYYTLSKYNATYEFFANLFAAKVTSKHVYYDNLIKHLPKSFRAFEKLFVIFYDHIQNNKRFNDVELIKETKHEL